MEETDGLLYWMELPIKSGNVEMHRLLDLMNEGNEILAIIVSSTKTARGGLK